MDNSLTLFSFLPSMPLPFTIAIAYTLILSHTNTGIKLALTRYSLAFYWSWYFLREGRVISFDWTAGGSACRPRSCGSKMLKRFEHTQTLYTNTKHLISSSEEEEEPAECEDCRLPLHQRWLKEIHSNMDTLLLQSVWKLLKPNLSTDHSMKALPGWDTRVGTWLWWPKDNNMASPRHYGISAQDITNVMQRLQGRRKMLTHTAPLWLAAFLEVT